MKIILEFSTEGLDIFDERDLAGRENAVHTLARMEWSVLENHILYLSTNPEPGVTHDAVMKAHTQERKLVRRMLEGIRVENVEGKE